MVPGGNPRPSRSTVRLTGEQLLRMSPFADVSDGTAVVRKRPAFDPVLAATLSRALRVDSALQFSASANSTTSPVHPVAGYPGTTTTTTGVQLGFDLQAAYSSILAAQRFEPTVAWVTSASYLRLRAEKTSAGTYRFEQGQPLLLDSRVMRDGSVVPVPVLPAIGFPEGQPVAIVADARAIYCVFREIQSGLLVRVDWSDHSSFDTDRFLARAAIRYDYGILAGFEGAVITISHKPS